MGPDEIAARLGVRGNTVATWRARPLRPAFPTPLLTVSRVPLWHWASVRAWASATGRLGETTGELAPVAAAEVRALRAEILERVAPIADAYGAPFAFGPLRRPAERAARKDHRGRYSSQDGRGDGRGEHDAWWALTGAERARAARGRMVASSDALGIDELADNLHCSIDDAWGAWIAAARVVDMADAMRRGARLRTAPFGGRSASDIFPDLAAEYGALELIFAPDAGRYLAERAGVPLARDEPRELRACYGASPLDQEWEEWRDEVTALRAQVDEIAEQEWPTVDDQRALARFGEILPVEILESMPGANLEELYVATVTAYLAQAV